MIHDRHKEKEGVDVTDALCKALGWYFPLLAKFKIRSVEDMVFRKFPYAGPYCRESPHNEAKCKTIMGTSESVNHPDLALVRQRHSIRNPAGLDDWQQMFQHLSEIS